MNNHSSRHPKIQYWDFTEKQNYREVINQVKENGCFDTLCLSGHTMNFWDLNNKPLIKDLVEYANSCGIRVPLQVFPKGFNVPGNINVEEATALVTEYEHTICDTKTTVHAIGKHARYTNISKPLESELLLAYAFCKTQDGFYELDSLIDITDRAEVIDRDPESLTMEFDTDGLQGYTVYVMVSHYYAYYDLFSARAVREYKDLIDAYADVPLSGIVLDEFKNMPITPPWQIDKFRERFYGKNFHRCFFEQTGNDLIQTMFDMRYCPCGKDEVRIRAINQYFDVFRHSTERVERFVAEYSEKIFGELTFVGLHNTYHNDLQNDELWQTGCNWWNVPRKYAQTDESIAYPIRMGITGGCPENLCYDMYYSTEQNSYLNKAICDARYGCRIHYHYISGNSSIATTSISWNTAHPEFLAAVKPYEEKIELLNMFDPVMPQMELLVVFGFPALCNWYPNVDARNPMDINGNLNIINRVQTLWNSGYLNALVPSDAIADGRITMKDGYFDYCGHKFSKMLFLYPEYSKDKVLSFLQKAIDDGYDLKILGNLTRDFDGKPAMLECSSDTVLTEQSDIPKEMNLAVNPIVDGCILEDHSVVITNYASIADDIFCTYQFSIDDYYCEATFKGVFAVKFDETGKIVKMAAGNLKEFRINNQSVLMFDGDSDYIHK